MRFTPRKPTGAGGEAARRVAPGYSTKALVGLALAALLAAPRPSTHAAEPRSATLPLEPIEYEGRFIAGAGGVEFLQRLDVARRLLEADPELPGLCLLYEADWDGLNAGPRWRGWWAPNSYGLALGAAPFLLEPLSTFLNNAQDLWFRHIGDGEKTWTYDRTAWMGDSFTWTPPDGCLPDVANDAQAIHKQGDGDVAIHDWALESTAAAVLMQAELLLVRRDPEAIAHYLPLMQRAIYFIESRRDPQTNLYLAGPAATLAGPAYGAFERFDGKRGRAFPAGLSVTYVAALSRLIELERLAGDPDRAEIYVGARDRAREGLEGLATDSGAFIRWRDPDGTRHGVQGAHQHGYFPTIVNHDAVALRVVDDGRARDIVETMLAVEGLRPHGVSIVNCPSVDDMYAPATGLLEFGRWFNGGHWTSCEGRMILACLRTGHFEAVTRSLDRLMPMIERFQMDNPLPDCGGARWFPDEPAVLACDMYAAPAALLRGLFEYVYSAQGLRLIPHIPPSVTRLEQRFPVRLGTKRIYLTIAGRGPIETVTVNGRDWPRFDARSVMLTSADLPETALVRILRKDGAPAGAPPAAADASNPHPDAAFHPEETEPVEGEEALVERAIRAHRFLTMLDREDMGAASVGAHARLAIDAVGALYARRDLLRKGRITSPGADAESRIQSLFARAADELLTGLDRKMARCEDSDDKSLRRAFRLYEKVAR